MEKDISVEEQMKKVEVRKKMVERYLCRERKEEEEKEEWILI